MSITYESAADPKQQFDNAMTELKINCKKAARAYMGEEAWKTFWNTQDFKRKQFVGNSKKIRVKMLSKDISSSQNSTKMQSER
jgi:hypothetical protein